MDAVQIEINPLAETNNGVVCVDAKIQFDDNSQFRHQDIFSFDETSELDPREVLANKHNLNYIGMNGDIGCLGKMYQRCSIPKYIIIVNNFLITS